MRLQYSKYKPFGFPHNWTVYHVRWMLEMPWVVLVDTDTKEWEHLTDSYTVCRHIATKITVDTGKRLVLIDPIDDDEVDQHDNRIATPLATPTS